MTELDVANYEKLLKQGLLEEIHVKELIYNLRLMVSALRSETAIHATYAGSGDLKNIYYTNAIKLAELREYNYGAT